MSSPPAERPHPTLMECGNASYRFDSSFVRCAEIALLGGRSLHEDRRRLPPMTFGEPSGELVG
jgi:hypothetical protein